MKKYHIYGVGNALVDIEFEVSPERLVALGVDKGVMTLVEEDQQNNIIEQLGGSEKHKASGGSGANTIIAVSQFGGQAFYSCKVSNDEMGFFYVEDLMRAGVTTNIHPSNVTEGVTGKCLVFVTPDADRTMNTYLGVSAEFSKSEVDIGAVEESEYVYVEGYLVTGASTKSAAIYLREHAQECGTKVAISLSDPNMVNFFKEGLLEMIGPGVDLLFANEEEALGMVNATSLDEALSYLKTISKEVVVTRGAQGAVICHDDQLIEVAGVPTKAIDTTGAGDMFAGAYIYGINHGMSRQQAGDLAARAASKLVASFGARLSKEQAQALLL